MIILPNETSQVLPLELKFCTIYQEHLSLSQYSFQFVDIGMDGG